MARAWRFDGQLRRLHKVRLNPTCAQERALIEMLRVTRELYNAPARRWNQIQFPHGDRALRFDSQQRVNVPGVGSVRLRKGRDVSGFGRAFIVTKNGRWYAVFEGHREACSLPANGVQIGLDRGIRVLAALSDGTMIANLRPGSTRSALIARHVRKLDALSEKDVAGHVRNRRDPARIAAARRLARAREREANARRDWLHKKSRDIINGYDLVAIEDLRVRSMTRSARGSLEAPGTNVRAKARLNRALLDAGFGILAPLIREKAAHAARVVVSVDQRNSSRTCAECGHVAKESREGARFACVSCGHEADADVNAARVILLRVQLAPTTAPNAASGQAVSCRLAVLTTKIALKRSWCT